VLIHRNLDNIAALQSALESLPGVPPPLAASSIPQLWVMPSVTGDVHYITVLNQQNITANITSGTSDDVEPMPVATLTWSTAALGGRPI
jgi:hypothetical protein